LNSTFHKRKKHIQAFKAYLGPDFLKFDLELVDLSFQDLDEIMGRGKLDLTPLANLQKKRGMNCSSSTRQTQLQSVTQIFFTYGCTSFVVVLTHPERRRDIICSISPIPRDTFAYDAMRQTALDHETRVTAQEQFYLAKK